VKSSERWRPLLTLACAAAFYFLVRALEGRPIPRWPYQPLLIHSTMLATALTLVACTWLFPRRPGLFPLLAHVVALGFGALFVVDWQSYPSGPGGITSDALFNSAIVVKHHAGLGNVDFSYRGLHGFYPSLYHRVVARLGLLTGTDPLAAMKHGFYWLAFLLPLVTHALWRRLLPPAGAFLMMVLALAILRGGLAFKPYEMLSLGVFVPWGLYHVAGLRFRAETGEWSIASGTMRDALVGGLIGGLLLQVYYYSLFLCLTWVPLLVVLELRRGGWPALRSRVRALALLGTVLLLVAAPYWVPLAGDFLRHGLVSYQNRHFQPYMLSVPLDVLGSWSACAGVLAIVLLAPVSAFARALVGMMVALLAFVLLGHVGMYLDFPLLHERMVHMEEFIAAAGLALGASWLLTRLAQRHAGGWERAPVVALAALACLEMAMEAGRDTANTQHQNAEKHRAPERLGTPGFAEACAGRVLLTDQTTYALCPHFLFIQPVAQFNHPSARFRERLRMLVLLQAARRADFVAWLLHHNRYDRVDYVLLEGNRLELYDDNYPARDNNLRVEVQLAPELLRGEFFAPHPSVPGLIAVRPVPEELWRSFDALERRVAALFSDVPGPRAELGAEWELLRAELDAPTKDHAAWQRAFHERWAARSGVGD
jgi:hypothetical protein